MMYIEHTNLEDNLHQILTDRLPTSSSPSASEATAAAAAAVAASALLARVREAHNSETSTLQHTLQVPSENHNHNSNTYNIYKAKERLKRPKSTILPVELVRELEPPTNKVLGLTETASPEKVEEQQQVQQQQDQQQLYQPPQEEEEEEEHYELFQVIDADQTIEAVPFNPPLLERSEQEQDNSPSTSHFVIALNDDQKTTSRFSQPQTQLVDEDEEFEYVITRVPKRKLGKTTANQATHTRKIRRPVLPEAIPIDSYLAASSYNGHLPTPLERRPNFKYRNNLQEYYTQREELNGYAAYVEDDNDYDYYSDFETVEAPPTGRPAYAYNNGFYSRQEAQMGLDIINKLKQLFNWNPSTNHYSTAQEEGKRKRRSDDWSAESTTVPHPIKYRKVENRFPKYVAARSEEDDINEFLPQFSRHNQQQQQQQDSSSKYDKQYLLNNSAQTSRTLLEMSNRNPASVDKPPLRKSMFSAPPITQQLIKNTSYADVEFSDDEEPILTKGFDIRPSTSNAVKRVPKVFNIPILPTDKILKKPPPPSIETRTGSILQSSLIPELETSRRPTYAETLRQNNPRLEHVLGGRRSISSSIASNSESSRILLNGLNINNLRTNPWSIKNRSSILYQEKESEEREKYQQLLEQVVPRLYGANAGENKFSSTTSSFLTGQRRKSGLLLGAPITSSSRSSPIANTGYMGLAQTTLKRPPLSSTINLDDNDTDEDVTVTGITHLKTARPSKAKQPMPTTVIIDDDEISDIIDLDNEEHHVLSASSKIQKEDNAVINLCKDKIEKPQKDALPYVKPVNSLQERFSCSPHIKDNWLENWHIKWLQRKKNRHEEVKETVKVAEKLSAERRAAEAEIQERLRKFQIVDPELLVVDDFEDVVEEPEFIEFTQEHRARINAAICGPLDETLISKFNLNITRRDIHTLCGHNWLNDEVINFYMNLLTERGERKSSSHGFPTVYAMNTFFVPRLMQAGHAGVKRWTRKVDIFSKDVVPVPVHVGGVHWCMAIIHLKNRTIKYYDSMGTPNPTVLKALEQYLKDESLDKRKKPFDTSDFTIESVQGVPRQMNGSDCGVFSCMFAEYITRNREITFSQQNMEYFRQKMILEIVMGELLQ